MKRFPKLKPNGWDGAVLALILLAAAGCGAVQWLSGRDGGAVTAVISVEGQELERLSLTPGQHCYTAGGYTLVLECDGTGIWVAQADCPTQDCVHTGKISRAGQSIVCVPSRIMVQLQGGGADADLPDAVLG